MEAKQYATTHPSYLLFQIKDFPLLIVFLTDQFFKFDLSPPLEHMLHGGRKYNCFCQYIFNT